MPIIKVARHDHGYVMIQNKALADERLSWKARGLLAYLLSRHPNWVVSSEQLSKMGPDGPTAVRSALKELRSVGYAELKFCGGKTGGSGWVIYESTDLSEINKTLISESSEIKETRDSGFRYPNKDCIKGTDSKVPLKGEEEAIFELTGYFTPDECSAYGANWRLRYRECPEKFKRLLADLDHSRRCPGKKRTQSWAAIANIRWNQLKPETKR
jgi:hypothetical protein